MSSLLTKIIPLALLLVFLTPGVSFAAPAITNVSGTISGGQAITVSGSGFGTHGDYGAGEAFLNAAWNDYEAGAFDEGNTWLQPDWTYQWSILDTGNRLNSTHYAQKVFVDHEGGEIGVNQVGTTGTWFISFWMRVDTFADQQSGKFFRIWGDNANIYVSTGGGDTGVRGYSECGSCSPSPTTVWGSPDDLTGSIWHRIDIEMAQNPDRFAISLDGTLQWQRSSTLSGEEDEQWVPNPFGGNGHTLGLGGMLDAPDRGYPANGFYHFDDFFVDYTLARAELCTGSTWSAHGVCEVQIPTAWGASSLSLTANPGAFANGTTAYLYVVDSTGAVNATGYPVTVGGTPDTTPPGAPSGLGVQ